MTASNFPENPNYAVIEIDDGMFSAVDHKDYDRLRVFNWHFFKKPSDKTGYAYHWGRKPDGSRTRIWMHNFIMGRKGIDHANRNGLDNRRENLRHATPTQQAYNKPVSKNNKSCGYKGVSFTRDRRGSAKYCIARITVQKKRVYLGTFENPIAAAMAYDSAAVFHHGRYACLNFPKK
jgi:hypothetical protein